MDIDTIKRDLDRRFSEPLPEYYHRRIIFWNDEDREFEDKIDSLHLEHAKLLILTGKNSFAAKKLLSHDDSDSNFLVYSPLSFPDQEKDWLLDIRLYSEEFRADLVSIWMNEMRLPSDNKIREAIKKYRKFFNAKDRRSKIQGQESLPDTSGKLRVAVMAAICGLKKAHPNDIIRIVLSGGLDQTKNSVYQDFVTYQADRDFWQMIRHRIGYQEDEPELGQLAIHLLLTAATRTMPQDHLAGLERFISLPHQSYCYDLIAEWFKSEQLQQLYGIGRYVEEEVQLRNRFSQLPLEDLTDTECFPCINEIILTRVLTDIHNQIYDTKLIYAIVEKRRTCAWYSRFENYYDGILQIANMQVFLREHVKGFHDTHPQTVWKAYTEDYYKMDRYYRMFHLAFQKSLLQSNTHLDDYFKQAADDVEGLYVVKFLDNLDENWRNVSEEDFAEHGKIPEIPQQIHFYQNKIRKSDSKIFVIISDAMRYEVAASLTEDLRKEMQSQVKLESMQSIFPSITKFGMAALLPHTELTVEKKGDSLVVLADGQSTVSTNRDKVLKSVKPASIALQYQKLIALKRADRCALVKGKEIIYIYHDVIDEASHSSDTDVFPACEKAISELKNMVRIIVNDFGGTNILITADHGFLYTYKPLREESKVDKTSFRSNDVEYGRRYAIVQKGTQPDYLHPVKFMQGKTPYNGFAPRGNIRIKLSGGGMNFVHGGTSLQEMVVPVINFHYLRNGSAEYKRNRQKYDTKPVEIKLLSANRKISNMIFNLQFYQTEALSGNREAATYKVYFTDENGIQISDVQCIIADKKNPNMQERTFRCSINLKPLSYSSTKKYYLVIADEKGFQPPKKEEFQIDIAFATDDFGFFD